MAFDYSRPLIKKVLVRSPTKAQYANGQREMPIMEIGMYKDEPGVFYDAQGRPVDKDRAMAPGGFTQDQVAKFMREAEKLKKIKEIEEQYRQELAEIEGEPEKEGDFDVSQTA